MPPTPPVENPSTDSNAGAAEPRPLTRFLTRTTAIVALACLIAAGGIVASILGAHSVARADANKTRAAFRSSAAGLASTMGLAIAHEEDLILAAGTFLAQQPNASPAQFEAWARSTQALRRYPELQRLGVVALVPESGLVAFERRLRGLPPLPATKTSTAITTKAVAKPQPIPNLIPPGKRAFYCLTAAEVVRGGGTPTASGADLCAGDPTLVSIRDAGTGRYTSSSVAGSEALHVQTPVYTAGTPTALTSRKGAFVGWLREVLTPTVVLAQALHSSSAQAVALRYRKGASDVTFTTGTPPAKAQVAASNLRGGWTLRTYGAPVDGSVTGNSHALALLIAGIVASILAGGLAVALGLRRRLSAAPATVVSRGEDLYDSLTRLPNRALTLDLAARMVARAGRQSETLAGALFIDIDWFKEINDKLGAGSGDQLLRTVGERLSGVVRSHDTVGRIGDDEFLILVESAARGARLDGLARRIIEALHKPLDIDGFGPSFFVTASIGVAFGRYTTAEDLMRDARLALYAAKAAGKDRYTVFNANMRSVIESRGVLEVELNTALAERQFFLLYEPIRDMATNEVRSMEASVGWLHPRRGMVAREDFMPLAEETGLAVPIGRWALEQAATDAAAWNVGGHGVGIAVKISAAQFQRDGFTTDVRRALQQSGLDPSMLTLEIGETTITRDTAASARRLAELKRLGIRIAIDDFGSSYANRADLQKLPLDFLNVDRRSLAASDDEAYRNWLLEAILVFARDLSLVVVAKGIDTAAQTDTLRALGCSLGQGALMGGAIPVSAVEALLTQAPALPPGVLPS